MLSNLKCPLELNLRLLKILNECFVISFTLQISKIAAPQIILESSYEISNLFFSEECETKRFLKIIKHPF